MSVLWPIVNHAIRSPSRVAAIDDQRQYTFGQLVAGAMFLAQQIETATEASHVGLLLPTGGAFPMALLGAWLARRVAVPLNYLLTPEEQTYVIRDSDIDTIITAGPMLEHLAKAAGPNNNPIPPDIKLLCLDEQDFTGIPPLRWPPVYGHNELAIILYTSGTSGKPKGVMLTHGNLRSNVEAAIEYGSLTASDVFLGVLPQFHSFGMTGLTLLPLLLGAKTIYSARFIPKRLVGLIQKHRPQVFVGIPSMYGAMLSVKSAEPEDFVSIRLAISGGEPLPQATFDQCLERFGLRLLEGYGLTETAPMATWSTPLRKKLHSVGTTLPGINVMVVDEHDQTVPANQEGEILICGPNVMTGYYKLPQQTREVFVDLAVPTNNSATPPAKNPGTRRFFRTGDIGRIDDDGYLYITGRKKEMLIIGGENVFPREIEEALNKHPAVRDSAVIGKPDGIRGELPIAFVEVEEDQTFDEAALRSWCRDHLAGYKVPREIRLIDALPRNPTGKIMRRNLPKV